MAAAVKGLEHVMPNVFWAQGYQFSHTAMFAVHI